MTAIILAGPAVEPISLAETKAFLRVDTGDEDEIISALVTAARLSVERVGRLALIRQTWRLTVARWPAGDGLRLPVSPVAAVIAARLIDREGQATALPDESVRLDAARDDVLSVSRDVSRSAPGERIEIDLQCGFGAAPADVPEPLRLAVRLLVANWFEHRGDEPDPGTSLGIPVRVQALIAPFRRARLA